MKLKRDDYILIEYLIESDGYYQKLVIELEDVKKVKVPKKSSSYIEQ